MALILSNAGAKVVNLGELTFSQLSDPIGTAYHKASVDTQVTGYNHIAIVGSSQLSFWDGSGNYVGVTSFDISIDATTGIATVTVDKGFHNSYPPKLTVIIWKD